VVDVTRIKPPPEDFDWPFLNDAVTPGSREELRAKFQMQMVSDIYKTMQTRLDGFRNSSAALFTGMVAAMVALDAAYMKSPGDLSAPHIPRLLLLASAAVCFAVSLLIRQIGTYFAEMTSIVYKIELASKVWEPNIWLPNKMLYPRKFKEPINVGIKKGDRDDGLLGWPDPIILWLKWIAVIIGVVHIGILAGKSGWLKWICL
jgi:hypothetical protein